MNDLIYHTVLVSSRNKRHGYFQEMDFGYLDLRNVSEDEAQIIFKMKDGSNPLQTFRLFNGYYYTDFEHWNKGYYFKDKQGRLTPKTAIQLMISIRAKLEESYCSMAKEDYILVGKRIYKKYCKKSELMITQCGNTLFGAWWSLDVESRHTNKSNVLFNRKNFDNELRKAKKRIGEINNRKKIYFSYPKIYWQDNSVERKN